MRRDPYSGEVFIFMNRARTRIKLLHWEPDGMVIYSKMLESGTFGRPSSIDADSPAGSLEWRELVLNADDAGLQPEQRTALRKEKSYPVIQAFEKWMQASYPKVSPQSRMGRAISYTYALLPRLSRYVNDGRINIDNNLIENTIRPLALGRKNYLFCGNDASSGILKSKVAGHAPESDQDRTTCRQLDTT